MPDWTAITGIVVSGVVGPAAAAWLAMRRSEREHQYARVLSDRAELRHLLDEAEQAMRAAERVAVLVPMMLRRWTRPASRASPQIDELRELLREVDRHVGRLSLRLGRENPVATLYREAFEALLKVDDTLSLVSGNIVYSDDDMKRGQAESRDRYKDATVAHAGFLAAANDLVASQLAPRTDGRGSN